MVFGMASSGRWPVFTSNILLSNHGCETKLHIIRRSELAIPSIIIIVALGSLETKGCVYLGGWRSIDNHNSHDAEDIAGAASHRNLGDSLNIQ